MNKEILDSLPRVKCKNELDALRKDGAFEAIVKETKTIWTNAK